MVEQVWAAPLTPIATIYPYGHMETSDAPSGVEFDIAGIAVAQGHKDDPTQR